MRFLPETRGQWLASLLVLVIVAGVSGFALGARDNAPSRSSVDVGFLDDMIAHHEQANQMSHIQLFNGEERDVTGFARRILAAQSYEIGLMHRQLEIWHHPRELRPKEAMAWMGMRVASTDLMPGMANAGEIETLSRITGRDNDALFIALMIVHHEGGLHMADYAAKRAGSKWIRDLAARVARNQRDEIHEMKLARDRLGLPERPAGLERPTVSPSSP